jgi:PTH1 family peptidyl-tRNA hydrolase
MAQIKLIVGLGNPGNKYRKTRHNFGFMVVDYLARQTDQEFASGKGNWQETRFHIAHKPIRAIKPETYMNLSGQAVRECAAYFRFEPEEVLVICDDINIPLGKIRIRAEGSAGGHNGLKDIIEKLGCDNFPRLRLGIGPQPEDKPSEVYVLEPFDDKEIKTVESTIKLAAEAVADLIGEGIASAQNKHN